MIELRSILITERPKGAATDERAPIYMDYGTPNPGLRQTMDLKSIWIIVRQQGAAPDDRALIHMDYATTTGGCARR